MTPIERGFEYQVRLAVVIPMAWATALKKIGEAHYDWKCKHAADRGVVNGLYNTAAFYQDSPDDSSHPISWSDCDLMLKILEEARHHTFDATMIEAIRSWLHLTMGKIALATRRAEESQ